METRFSKYQTYISETCSLLAVTYTLWLDMALYMEAKKLQMARDDLNNIILCVGELHVVMTQLRTIGALIENSGIDMVCRI